MNVNPTLAPEKLVWAAEPQNKIKDLPNLGFDGDAWYSPMSIGEARSYDNSIMLRSKRSRQGRVRVGNPQKPRNHPYLVLEGGHRLGYSDMGMETLYKEAEKHQVNLCLIGVKLRRLVCLHSSSHHTCQHTPKTTATKLLSGRSKKQQTKKNFAS